MDVSIIIVNYNTQQLTKKCIDSIFEKTATTDVPSQIYLEKCNFYIQNPPENWQGVWIAESK